MRYFIILLLLLCCSVGHAQVLEGIVLDAETKSSIQGVTIVNKHTRAVVFTDSQGYYKLQAAEGDTISFSHTAYKTLTEVMPYSMGKTYKTIELKMETYNLKQATIKGMTQYQKDSIAKREMYEHTINKTAPKPKYTGLGVSGGVSYLADKILGISKKQKKFKNNLVKDEQQGFIDTRYTTVLVSAQTGMKDVDNIAAFMAKYPMTYQYARQAGDLEMKLWIRNNYAEYITKHKEAADKR